MSFGLVTYNEAGEENFRGEFKTLRVSHYQRISAGFSGDVYISGVAPWNTVAYCVSTGDSFSSRDLFCTVYEGFIRLTPYNASYPPLEPLNLIVMRIS